MSDPTATPGRLDPVDYSVITSSLSGIVLMIDSRLGATDLDRQLMSFIGQRVGRGEVRLLVLLTKADKLTRAEAQAALAAMQALLGEYGTEQADIGVTLFSALNREGVDDAATTIHAWISRTA